LTDPNETENSNSEQLEGEKFHDQRMEEWSSRKEQPAGIKRGGKIKKLTAVDIGKLYLVSGGDPDLEYRLQI
jgi:hypothetical protein